jgi:hypothetical protein
VDVGRETFELGLLVNAFQPVDTKSIRVLELQFVDVWKYRQIKSMSGTIAKYVREVL